MADRIELHPELYTESEYQSVTHLAVFDGESRRWALIQKHRVIKDWINSKGIFWAESPQEFPIDPDRRVLYIYRGADDPYGLLGE